MRARMGLAWLVAVLAWLFQAVAAHRPPNETAEARPAPTNVGPAGVEAVVPPAADLPSLHLRG